MMNKPKIPWGIIGTGRIARIFAEGLRRSETGQLTAVASRSRESAEAFARDFGINDAHASYEALLADDAVEAIYISTPHSIHAEWAIKAARAGKHVLCEKPIGINHAQAMQTIEAAVESDVFLMEAFMYRCHPQTHKLVELIRQRAIGDVRVIHATFSFHVNIPPGVVHRITDPALGGGGILDVGCYCTSMARLVAGVAQGKDFAEPEQLKAVGHVGETTRVDEWTVASLKFPGEILAQLATGITCQQESIVRIDGSEGSITLPTPWVPARDGGTTKIILTRHDEREPRELLIESPQHLYAIEADVVGRAIREGRREAGSPAMTWEDTLGNMRTLDRWRGEIGLTYEAETPAHFPRERLYTPLADSRKHPMKYARIPGLEKDISRLVLGCDNQRTFPDAAAIFDAWFDRGGNAFDTAFIYHRGLQEHLLGEWIKLRGVREQVVLIVKGAHTPYCNPIDLTTQLDESLSRLNTDYADVYLLHRDNPQIPTGEFVNVLNEHLRAGRIRAFGGSNWSPARVDEANEYAQRNRLVGFTVLSNQLSLARMIDVPWHGCIGAGDDGTRDWLKRTQLALLPWASQAQGFFVDELRPDNMSRRDLARCWHSDDNLERLRRTRELASKYHVLPTNIALAWVLHQPFPTFPLIGPRRLSELRTTLPALTIELTSEEVRWLNLDA